MELQKIKGEIKFFKDENWSLEVSGKYWKLPPTPQTHLVDTALFLSSPCQLLQSCLTLCDPVDCSLPGSSVCGDSPGKNTGVGCHALL